jgi:hypothetical protein
MSQILRFIYITKKKKDLMTHCQRMGLLMFLGFLSWSPIHGVGDLIKEGLAGELAMVEVYAFAVTNGLLSHQLFPYKTWCVLSLLGFCVKSILM